MAVLTGAENARNGLPRPARRNCNTLDNPSTPPSIVPWVIPYKRARAGVMPSANARGTESSYVAPPKIPLATKAGLPTATPNPIAAMDGKAVRTPLCRNALTPSPGLATG